MLLCVFILYLFACPLTCMYPLPPSRGQKRVHEARACVAVDTRHLRVLIFRSRLLQLTRSALAQKERMMAEHEHPNWVVLYAATRNRKNSSFLVALNKKGNGERSQSWRRGRRPWTRGGWSSRICVSITGQWTAHQAREWRCGWRWSCCGYWGGHEQVKWETLLML